MLHPSSSQLERDQRCLDLLRLHRQQWHQLSGHQTESRRQLRAKHQVELEELMNDRLRYGSVIKRHLTELVEWMHVCQLHRDQLRLQQQQELAALRVIKTDG